MMINTRRRRSLNQPTLTPPASPHTRISAEVEGKPIDAVRSEGDDDEEAVSPTLGSTPSQSTRRRQDRRNRAKAAVKKAIDKSSRTKKAKQTKTSPRSKRVLTRGSSGLKTTSEADKENVDVNVNVDVNTDSLTKPKSSSAKRSTSKSKGTHKSEASSRSSKTALTVRRRSREAAALAASPSRHTDDDEDDDRKLDSKDEEEEEDEEWKEEKRPAKRTKRLPVSVMPSPPLKGFRVGTKQRKRITSASGSFDDLAAMDSDDHPAQESEQTTTRSAIMRKPMLPVRIAEVTKRSKTSDAATTSTSSATISSPVTGNSNAWELSPTSHPSSSRALSTSRYTLACTSPSPSTSPSLPASPSHPHTASDSLSASNDRSWDCLRCGCKGKTTGLPAVGELVAGVVANVNKCGVFVDIGEEPKLQITMSLTSPSTVIAPDEGSIHTGTVSSVHGYGIFITIPGYAKQGMLRRCKDLTCGQTDTGNGRLQYDLELVSDAVGYPSGSAQGVAYGTEQTQPASHNLACLSCGSSSPYVHYSAGTGYGEHLQQQQHPQQQHATADVLDVTLESLQHMRLDRDTLLQWYTTSADQFETIVNGFLVRVKDMSNQYAIGRVVGCERIAPYRHDLLGSLVCNLNLLVRVSGDASEPKPYALYMTSSQPFLRDEFEAYQLRVAMNPEEALTAPSELQQKLRVKRIMHERLLK
ncbi:papain family cysteine protease subfamily protein [Acanthamoeba castellanii str. Neff]|uniref:Papain family cysteine protease subfamily protein n=1 Tax=Acanthamoeba castellanii (strain ATCC 30010 / Neff) TaxID=1257118 RepID=L8GK02_ACACF|nr:papain family cysteine protease subfamily protein [Acanthamoeba castellanii str. Neff]ELR13410.1 papain family cysteine protease subfamily protein [Acanthamoeba castellanii str. Neff]